MLRDVEHFDFTISIIGGDHFCDINFLLVSQAWVHLHPRSSLTQFMPLRRSQYMYDRSSFIFLLMTVMPLFRVWLTDFMDESLSVYFSPPSEWKGKYRFPNPPIGRDPDWERIGHMI
jgi:hypothetical protein